MCDFSFMLCVKLPVVDRIRPQSNMFASGVENKAIGDLKLNNGSEMFKSARQTSLSSQPVNLLDSQPLIKPLGLYVIVTLCYIPQIIKIIASISNFFILV